MALRDRLDARKPADDGSETSRIDGLSVVANRPSQPGPSAVRQTSDAKTNIPEPTTLAMWGVAGWGLIRRVRRRAHTR